MLQWNLKRQERKQLEKYLLKYQVSTVRKGLPTDQQKEQGRAYITGEHVKQLKEELPYIKRLVINFNRNQAQYAVDRQVKDLAIQRDPDNASAIGKEYSENLEWLDFRQRRGEDLLKVAKTFSDYAQQQGNLRENIRQEEIRKLQEETNQMVEAQWKMWEEEIQRNALKQIARQKSHLQQKESEWAEKIRWQQKLARQLEDRYKNVQSQESKRILDLQNQLCEKQLETEKHWSELANT